MRNRNKNIICKGENDIVSKIDKEPSLRDVGNCFSLEITEKNLSNTVVLFFGHFGFAFGVHRQR